MKVVAIIPARGGSRRLPRKNVQPVAGRPLILHSIEHAVTSTMVSRTIVSTNDLEIASISRTAGAEVIIRPPELSTDTATSESALLHVLAALEQQDGYRPDLVVFLQCTSPVRRRGDIDGAIQHLVNVGADSLFSATESKWLLWRSAGPWAESFNYDYRKRRREQDMIPEWRENGSIYVFKPWVLYEQENRLGGKIAVYEMDYWSSFQIDSKEELDLCDWILRGQAERSNVRLLPDRISAVAFDFDGVFTDNHVMVAQDGTESVRCDRSDGWGLDRLRETGVPLVVLSTEANPVVAARCRKVKLECRHGLENKAAALAAFARERGVSLSEMIYVGNDANDRECLQAVGCPIVVGDAHQSVRALARVVLASPGGRGAVREVCELILTKLGLHYDPA
jgi:N-acylneuraminate cytidylyltransferase